ncbi:MULTISPECIES: hypothetical protein [unclassified Lysobacter]|uniref:hypothetical protein n=1 Tax=unclassified Lysobacter TaxID=2635362 RepID=UPI001BEA4BBB|nr:MULTISPECIES: hypothetical protein [unclassified Lysobacter]MBT2749112.1 hypothetical protein [Lysobacter sp. ISL-42]MBT2754228.1 hypothetical protein [Lysobacter sp. ISL-50]MBT2779557.1 hypothetical protein [Lysobacter sp. ISL-54]MBT2784323.1 hypothetical protein [Lysobacter sp. ISL-52]
MSAARRPRTRIACTHGDVPGLRLRLAALAIAFDAITRIAHKLHEAHDMLVTSASTNACTRQRRSHHSAH